MGKRKSSKPPPKGKKDTLSTTFKCLFCNHEKSVSVVLDKKQYMIAKLKCKDCGQNFQCPIHNLSLAVDVYADWVDACEEARLRQPPKERPQRNPNTLDHGFAGGSKMTMIGNEEDDDDLDAEGEPAPEEEESDVDSLIDDRPVKRRERRRSDSAEKSSRGKKGKERESDKAPSRKAVDLYDDDDDDD